MQLAQYIFLTMSIAFLLGMLAGLYKPWIMLWWMDVQNRKEVIKRYGFLACFTYLIYALIRWL